MSDKKTRQVIDDLRGGRNGYDPPWAIKDTQCVDAVNVDFYRSRLGNKRGGMTDPALTSGFSGTVSSLFRHVPSTDETAAELWGTDDSGTPAIKRLTGGMAWAAPTLKDAPTGNGWDFTAASINGKLALAYKSAQGRLHFWDGSTVRRGGLAATAAPTAANNGTGGTYGAILRYYRQRVTRQTGGVTIGRSEPSTYVSFTPDGAHTAATVTQATPPGEGETHWEIEASLDSVTFYRIATVAIGTTTYDDSAATTTYNSNTLSDLTGKYQLQKAYRFVASDQNRLLGLGSYTPTDKQSRLEISAVIGSADVSDEERVDTSAVNSIIDFDEGDSGTPTGLVGPVFGQFFVFKQRTIYQLTATGSTAAPYRQDKISPSIGAIEHVAITKGEDALGNAALYWMSHRGAYRWSINGLEYIGRNMEDYVLGPTATINLAATKRVAVTVYYPDKRQVWFWWATGTSNDPNTGAIYDVQTGGWSRIPSGDLWAAIRCAVPFANTLGASMSRDLKIYAGQVGAVNRTWKTDSGTDDNGTPYQAYVLTKAAEPGGPGFRGETGDAVLLAKASSGVTITDTLTVDYGRQLPVTGVADISAETAETRVSVALTGSGINGVSFIQHQLGDAAPIANSWTLDRLIIPIVKHQAVSA